MDIKITDEFIDICEDILSEEKSEDEWALIESDDMFQSDSFCGGYNADEMSFCFSYYATDGKEYWFQLTLDEIEKIVNKSLLTIPGRVAEK